MIPDPTQLPRKTLKNYRPDIDGLRAIAVLLVVIFHAFPRFIKGGFIGVDVFFVISGYLISTIIFSSLTENRFSYIGFYIRRIKRILPALMLVLSSSIAFGWYVLLNDEYRRLGTHIVASTGFFLNFLLWNEAGYFDHQSFEKPLLHLWSLAIEEQFYIFWPLLLGVIWKIKQSFLTPILIILSSSFIINIYLVNSNETSDFYAPWSRFWGLMIGCPLAYMALYKPRHSPPLNKNWNSIIGFALILLAALLLDRKSAFPGWWALMPTIGAFLIIDAGPDVWINRHVLNQPKMVWIGLISYPLYLWHWPILSFIRIIFFKEEVHVLISIAAIAFSILLAWLTYDFLEKKIRYSQRKTTTVALLGVCIFCTLIGLSIQQGKPPARNDNTDIEQISRALNDIEDNSNHEKQLKKREVNNLSFYYLGDNNKKENVLFIGDSHIWHYIPRIVELSKKSDFKMKYIYLAIVNACPVIPGVFDDIFTKCKKTSTERLEFALNPEIESVVIGACWNCLLTSSVEKPIISSTEDPRKAHALNVLENSLKQIAAQKKVYLLLDNPNNRLFNPRNFINGSRLTKPTLRNLDQPIPINNEQEKLREELIAIANRSGAIVIDPLPSLCQDEGCHILTDEGEPIYIDNHHLSASWVKKFADYIDIAIKASDNGS